jgi:hypothetical protein
VLIRKTSRKVTGNLQFFYPELNSKITEKRLADLICKTLRNYLKPVTMSKTKGLACQKERFFAALRMTLSVLR